MEGLLTAMTQLMNLPASLTAEARPIVERHARGAYDEIRVAYPRRTGQAKLGESMHLDDKSERGHVQFDVTNQAPLAYIFEFGTDTRQTTLGANRGKMPAGHVFYPRAARWRHAMEDELVALLEREGFAVGA
jgi:hypothetical protein